jgi:hypothetical protein
MYAKPLPKQTLLVVNKREKHDHEIRDTKVISVARLNGAKSLVPKPLEGYIKCKRHDPL